MDLTFGVVQHNTLHAKSLPRAFSGASVVIYNEVDNARLRLKAWERALAALDGWEDYKHPDVAAGAVRITWDASVWEFVEGGGERTHDGFRYLGVGVSPHRYIVWARLRHRVTGKIHRFVGTHCISGVRGKGKAPRARRLSLWMGHVSRLRTLLKNWLGERPEEGVTVCGDFNRGPQAVALRAPLRLVAHSRVETNGEIDQVWSTLRCRGALEGRKYGSDHPAVRAVLTDAPTQPKPPEDTLTTYAKANTKAAWYQDDYPGAVMKPNCAVIHTTEGTSLPGYNGGATAPNYTAVPDFKAKRLRWFAHFPDERSSRALRNLRGGVETNTANAIQVELVGTCDPATRKRWKTEHIFWPEAPEWALRDLAHFVADMNRRHGIPIQGPADVWTPYPESYGAGGQRFSYARWRSFYGWCGHQHVPENSHGDPGAFPWGEVARRAKALLDPEPEPQPDDMPNRVEKAVMAIHAATEHGIRTVPVERVAVHRDFQSILTILDRMRRREQ